MLIKKYILCSDSTANSISVPGYVNFLTHTIWLLRATTSTITHQTHSKRLGRRSNMLYCEITRLDVFIVHLARARQANTDRQRSLVARAVQPPPIGVTPPDKPLRRCLLCVLPTSFCSPCGRGILLLGALLLFVAILAQQDGLSKLIAS
jgi:hypothetical protein